MGSYGDPQTPQADARTEDHFPKMDSGETITEDSMHTAHEHRKVKLVPIWNLHSYDLVSLVQGGSLQATERETQTLSQPQNLQSTIYLQTRQLLALNLW